MRSARVSDTLRRDPQGTFAQILCEQGAHLSLREIPADDLDVAIGHRVQRALPLRSLRRSQRSRHSLIELRLEMLSNDLRRRLPVVQPLLYSDRIAKPHQQFELAGGV